MKKWSHRAASVLLLGVIAVLAAPARDGQAAAPSPMHIGLIKTMFRDTPEGVIITLARPLMGLMESQTGLNGQWKVVSNALLVAKQLESQDLHIAVLHSFEYGWARKANPKIRPLVVANRIARDNRYVLVVNSDSSAESAADLKGTKVAIPVLTKEPAHLFLEVKCCENCPPNSFFKETVSTADAAEALDSVILEDVQAALVEKNALDAYFRAKPKQVKALKVFKISEDFPSGVLVYREGHIPEDVLERCRNGLLNAGNDPKARQLLKLAQLNGFSNIPADFDNQIDELIKAYPTPLKR